MTPDVPDASDTLEGSCLDDTVLAALALGTLEEAARSVALLHVDDCEVCQALLAEEVRSLPQRPPAPPSAALLAVERREQAPLLSADSLVAGRYEIRRFLSRGGMGEVYEAHDILLGQRLALKTLSAQAAAHAELKAQERFKQEVLMARRVADPHVCRIHEFGQHVIEGFGPIFYLTMEYIEGETLGARVRRGPPLSLEVVKSLSRQLLRGLAAAHAAGVLHRDFKSDNVMLRERSSPGEGWEAVILDFGLARGLEREYEGLTEQHEFLGSAGYMAPEQLLEGEPLSEATDLYAFGVVLFEMLTQVLPFQGRSARAVAFQRLVHSAPPPSSVVPALGAEWDALVGRCLEREAARRFPSAWAVLEQLDALGAATSLRAASLASTAPLLASTAPLPPSPVPLPAIAAGPSPSVWGLMLVLAAVAALVFTVDWLSQRRRAPVLVTAPAVSSPILPPGVTPAPNLGATGAPQPQLETSKLAARPAPAPAPAVPASPSPVVQSRRARAERPAAPAGEVNVAPAAAGDDIRKRFYTEAPDGP